MAEAARPVAIIDAGDRAAVGVAIDGKTLCRFYDRANGLRPPHLVGA